MQMPFDKVHIIQKMLELGLIDRAILGRVLLMCKNRNIDILKVLANYAGMSLKEIQEFAAKHFDLPVIELSDLVLNPDVVRMIPHGLARQHRLIPAFKISQKTHVAVSNPFDFAGISRLKDYIGEDSRIFISPEEQILQTIKNYESN